MKKILLITLLLLLIQGITYAKNVVPSADKMSLSVLYVGYDPAKAKPEHINYYSTSAAAINEAWKTRMVDFKAFLLIRFSKVEVVDVRDYNVAMSDKVDVTIMDAGPVKLPVGFNRPMILMHEMAPNVGA
jgi:hypothetical protein